MRVLLVHNFYGSTAPSGENRVVEAEWSLLERHGHRVELFARNSDTVRARGVIGAVGASFGVPWNVAIVPAIREAVARFRPDVVHVHNTFPLISPAIFHAIGARAAKVLTLHNFRLLCPAAIPMRDGQICTKCIDRKSVGPALLHGCYRASRLATLPVAAGVALHRALGTWKRDVDAFIALTEFQRDRFVQAGFDPDRIHVKPNFFAGDPTPLPWPERDVAAVFAGRLSQEKGVDILVSAWLRWGESAPPLRIVGDGPLLEVLQRSAERHPEVRISFHGQLEADEAAEMIARARLLIVPSVCFEGFPMVMREAFAFGTPCAVSELGPLPSIVRPGIAGFTFQPGNVDSLLQAVQSHWSTDELAVLGAGARAEFKRAYNEDVNIAMLAAIYNQARRHQSIGSS